MIRRADSSEVEADCGHEEDTPEVLLRETHDNGPLSEPEVEDEISGLIAEISEYNADSSEMEADHGHGKDIPEVLSNET